MSGGGVPLILGPTDGEVLRSPLGGAITVLARAEQTSGATSAYMAEPLAGEGPPLHVHPDFDETIYIVSGDFRVRLNDELKQVPTGAFVFIPRGAAHTWQNIGQETGRFLFTIVPAGLEGFFDRMAAVAGDTGAFRRVGAEEGLEVIGPPLAQSDPL